MDEDNKYIDKEKVGEYIAKCLGQLKDKSPNWLGEEVYRRDKNGEEPTGQALATCHHQAKQWLDGIHLPSLGILFILSGIFGKSLNELLAGRDLTENADSHLTLFSVARSNSLSLYRQLCAAELDGQMDEYGKTLLQYVLEFQSDKILSAMLDNGINRVEFFGSFATDPGSTSPINLGDFLPTAAKDTALFAKLYTPGIPWSFSAAADFDMAHPIIKPTPEAMLAFIKQKGGREVLLKEYEQKHSEWINRSNFRIIETPCSSLPYLSDAFNCALEVSLNSGDGTFAAFGAQHNQKVRDFLAEQKIPLSDLKIDEYGRVSDRCGFIANLAYLPTAKIESPKLTEATKEALTSLSASLEGYGVKA
jgi:hypothetical protein